MSRNPYPSFNVPNLTLLPDGEYSLGVPVDEGAVQVGTSRLLDPETSRLQVVKQDDLLGIQREDGVALQAVAKNRIGGSILAPVFGEPIDSLTVVREARRGRGRRSDMWTPSMEGLSITNEMGLQQLLYTVAMYAHVKYSERMNQDQNEI